ncbi:hypothetical protein Tco_0152507 [Tanacetum coccineum]
MPTEMELSPEQTQQGVSYEVLVCINRVEDEKEIFNTTVGNPVKKILLKLNLSDHRSILTDLKLKNLKKDIALKFFKSTIQDKVHGIVRSRNHKSTRWQSFKMAKRLYLVDDLKMLKIIMSNISSRNKLNPEINDHYNIFTRESQEYELKTKDEA